MKILLPVDGSEGSLAAVRHALMLVLGGLRAEFVLANVQAPASLYEVVVAHDAGVIEQVAEAAAEDALAPARAMLTGAGCRVELEVGRGEAGHLIVDIAERHRCDAVILGTHGAAAGDVASWVLQHATVPVTVVRARADA